MFYVDNLINIKNNLIKRLSFQAFFYIDNMSQEKYISLFDFLGKAAGNELGKQVHDYSKIKNIKPQIREVNTKTYKGKVMLYPENFIQEFFQIKKIFTNGK